MNKEEIDNLLEEKLDSGEKISPVLPDGIKNYLIDIDGTICDDIPNEEPERMATAKVYPDALETLNRWYNQGHVICFFTSRTEDHRKVTEKWLNDHGFKYHSMVMEESSAPNEINNMMTNIENNGAPWQFNNQDRINWINNN